MALIPKLSVQLFPSDGNRSIDVSCAMNGASPQTTEATLTSPLESTLSRLKGVQDISSTTTAGSTNITIKVDKWTDLDLLRFNIAVTIRQLYPKLPQGASYPQISISKMQKSTENGAALMTYTLNGPGLANEIAREAEKNIRPVISTVKGVYRFDVSGNLPMQLIIKEKGEIMQSLGLSHNELGRILFNAFSTHDLGLVIAKQGSYNLTIGKSISQQNALVNYPIVNKNGKIFRLADVAIIDEEEMNPSSFFRINGDNLINMSLYAEKGVNSIKLAEDIKRVMETLGKTLPKGYELKLQYDGTELIKEELNRIYLRTFLSVFILLAFTIAITRQFRYIIIIIASLLVNTLLSFIFYYIFGLQIHLYSLAGITVSLGLVIDNSIVIVEEIRRTGRNRIFMAILASTLTSLGALSVIFFLNEMQKNNLVDFAIAIIINLLVSLPIAYFFMPAILDKIPIAIKGQQIFRKRKQRLIKFNSFFEKQLDFMLRFRFSFFFLFMILFGIPTFLFPIKVGEDKAYSNLYNYTLGSGFYQNNLKQLVDKYLGGTLYLYVNSTSKLDYNENEVEKPTSLNANVSMPKGATLHQMNDIVMPFEVFLKKHVDKFEVFTSSILSPTEANINIIFKKRYETGYPQQLKRQLEAMAIYSGAADFGIYGVGRGFNNSMDQDQFNSTLTLTGYNYDQLQRIALQLRDTLMQNPRVRNILISTLSNAERKPYFEYVLQMKKAELLVLNGINQWDLRAALHRGQSNQISAGYISLSDKEELPVALVSHNKWIPSLWEANNEPLRLDDTTYLRLGNLSESKKIRIGESIVRQNQSYQLNVHYQFIGSDELNQAVKNNVVKNMQDILPFGYKIFDRNWASWNDGSDSYIWLILVVFFIIFMISAVLLESLKQALVIVMMIPFSFVGVFLCFYLLGLKFDQGGYAALLMLAGLVTNASLYIINDLNFYRKKESNSKIIDAKLFIKSFNAKAMPIIVTTASAILSLLPFMISGDEKGFWFTLSAGTIGGLVFSVLGVYLFLPLCLISKKHSA